MVKVTLASLKIIISMDKANLSGKIIGVTTVPGKITRCMAKANSHGPMVVNTLETIMRTEKKVQEHSSGKTAAAMKDSGRTVSNMG